MKTLESEKCGMMKVQGENDTTSNEIQELEEKHEKEQMKLATATAEENTAAEEAELKGTE